MPVTQDEFRSALSRFATGITVVTARDDAGRPHGITVSAFSSVSLEPPLILVCIEKGAFTHDVLLRSERFVVNVLNNGQRHISELFASTREDRFEEVEISMNIDGIAILHGCLATLECLVKSATEAGDHTIFIGEVDSVNVADGDPLLYFRGDYRIFGE